MIYVETSIAKLLSCDCLTIEDALISSGLFPTKQENVPVKIETLETVRAFNLRCGLPLNRFSDVMKDFQLELNEGLYNKLTPDCHGGF